MRSQTDARLVDLTRDGNERAFEAIVQRYRRPLLRYCSRLLSPSRAEDAVQHAFLSAHRAIHEGDADLNLRPWLYRIAHNASLNLLRQHGYDHDEVSEEIDGVETPPQAFERGERLRTVVAAVQELPERQRSAIVLQAVEGRSYDEIADELGVSGGAVRQLLNRARNTLREAAAALTPTGLLTRIGDTAAEAPVAERVAQTVAGAGGGALLAKAGATLVLAGAVAGGAATGGLPGTGGGGNKHEAAAVAAATGGAQPGGGARPRVNVALTSRRGSSGRQLTATQGRQGGGAHHGTSAGGHAGNGSKSSGGGARNGGGTSGHHSGSGNNSGSGSGDHSGSGSGSGSSSGGDHSGSGDGSGSSGSSGSSSGSSDGGSSDGGSSGSGGGDGSSSGSGSITSGSGTSGSGTSGSGTSGSGSDEVTTTTDRSGSGGSSDSLDTSDDPSGTSGSH